MQGQDEETKTEYVKIFFRECLLVSFVKVFFFSFFSFLPKEVSGADAGVEEERIPYNEGYRRSIDPVTLEDINELMLEIEAAT